MLQSQLVYGKIEKEVMLHGTKTKPSGKGLCLCRYVQPAEVSPGAVQSTASRSYGHHRSGIQSITISHVIVDKPYNDLGFTVKGRQLVLAEAQSTWSFNILIRLLVYFVDTLLGYIKDHPDLDVHSTARIPLPIPEFYVIYTEDKKRSAVNQYSEGLLQR